MLLIENFYDIDFHTCGLTGEIFEFEHTKVYDDACFDIAFMNFRLNLPKRFVMQEFLIN